MLSSCRTQQRTHRYQVIALLSGAAVIMIAIFDLSQVNSVVRENAIHSANFVKAKFNIVSDSTFHDTTIAHTKEEEICRVQFVFAGSKYDYGNFPTLQSWVRYADPSCEIDLIRTNHPFLDQLNPAERHMLRDMDFLPILQADFMKLLVVYYRGGVVADLDVEALKPFPNEWTGPQTTLSTCDVVLGVEVACYDDECVKGLVRKGQIQNWTMWARRRFSPFLGELLEYVIEKYKTFPPHDPDISVQEVAGSATITDFLYLYANFSSPLYEIQTTLEGGTLQSDSTSVLRFRKHHEEVCIVGPSWTGGGCRGNDACVIDHHYEGSWKHQNE